VQDSREYMANARSAYMKRATLQEYMKRADSVLDDLSAMQVSSAHTPARTPTQEEAPQTADKRAPCSGLICSGMFRPI